MPAADPSPPTAKGPERNRRRKRAATPASPLQAARWATRKQAWEIAEDIAGRCPGHLRGGELQPCAFDEWQLSKYENNRKRPCTQHQVALCQVYGKGPEELGFITWRPQPAEPAAETAPATPTGPGEQGGQIPPSEPAAGRVQAMRVEAGSEEGSVGPQANPSAPAKALAKSPEDSRIVLNATNAPEIPYPEDDSASSDLTLSDASVAAKLRAALTEHEVEVRDPLQRRSVVKGMWVVAGVTLTDPITALASQVRTGLAATEISTDRLEMLQSAVRRHASAFSNACTPEFARELATDWVTVSELLKPRVTKTPSQTIELTRLYSQLCGLLGVLELDLGHYERSRTLHQTGQAAAREVGDADLAAWHLAVESMAPYYTGDPRETIEIAERGLAVVGRCETRTAAWLHARIARSLGELARHDPTLLKEIDRRLEEARRILGRARDGAWDGAAGLSRVFCFSEDRFAYYAGAAWIEAGNTAKGRELCRRATNLQRASRFPDVGSVDYSFNRFYLARAYAVEGEPVQASEIAREALDAYTGHSRNVLRRAEDDLQPLLSRYQNEPAVQEYRGLLTERARSIA